MDEGLLASATDQPTWDCPIPRYNCFIAVYNQVSNRVAGTELQLMTASGYFTRIWETVSPNWVKVPTYRT